MARSEKEKRERIDELISSWMEEYVYIKSLARYYCPVYKKFFNSWCVSHNILGSSEDIIELRKKDIIKSYDDICYLYWGLKGSYNLLDETLILKPSSRPILDSNIEKLIHNVCGYNKENIEYIYKAIYYKYTHINDFNIPAIVLYWSWWSGKGSLITLLWSIFGKENVLPNLGQADLDSDFSTYKGNKIVVEFAEISVNNTAQDVRNLNKLKNLILAPHIIVNEKWIQQYQMPNIAWFFISSNSNNPIRLDDKQKGNRRFSIIYSKSSLSQQEGFEINQSIINLEVVSNFLAWLTITYPEIKEETIFSCLDNQDKRDLEDQSTSDYAVFWEWFKEKYPEKKWKILLWDIKTAIDEFVFEFWFDEEREFRKYFWKNSKYPKKRLRIEGQDYMPYGIFLD